MSAYQLSEPPAYLSAASANALISDIQPTTIHPQTLQHINLFLDEILYSLLDAAQSLNPSVLRSTGVPAVFSADKSSESTAIRSLGRSAIGEAELELRSWVEANGSLKEGFGRDGKGTGMKRGPFVLQKAYEVMRGRCEEFSTLAGEDGPRDSMEGQRMAAWVACGGNGEDIVLSPAALYATAILEHVCEHVLAALARVAGRDSDNTSASLEDLFTAIAEDDGIWGFFKRMQVRVSLEEAIKARQKRAHPSRPTDRSVSRASPSAPYSGSQTSLIQSSSSGAIRDQADSTKKSSLPPSAYDQVRASHDTSRSAIASGGISSSASKSPPMGSSARFGGGIAGGPNREAHVRSPSVLSASTRNMIGAYNDQADSGSQFGRSRRDEEDDFDALVASGETMKVSLTPSRLKGFDGGRKQSPNAGQAAYQRRDRPSGASPPRQEELPPLLPRTNTPSQASGAGDTPPRPPRSSSMRSRAGSASAQAAPSGVPKLLPRSASIVAEMDDSEDLADELDSPFKQRKGGRANKESLAELLASTGPAPEPPFSFDDGKERKRTVPAVIVGTAPPRYDDMPEPPRSGESAPRGSVNRPGRVVETVDTDDFPSGKKKTPARDMADFFNDGPPSSGRTPPSTSSALPSAGGKPKTSAQEMADFFNNTPPPPSSTAPTTRFGAPVENLAPPPAKKGFKGFISKIGGGGGGAKRKGSTDLQVPDEGIPTAGGPSWVGTKGYQAQVKAQGLEGGRKKSFAGASAAPASAGAGVNYAEGGTRASSIADAYRSQQSQQAPRLEPALPPLPTSSSAEPQSPTSPQTSALPTPTAQKRLSQTSLSGSTKGGLSRKISTRKPVPYADSGVSPETPSSPTLAHPPPSFSPTLPSSPPMAMSPSGRGAPRKPSTVDEDVGSDFIPDQPVPQADEAPVAAGREKSLREEKSTDQMSFATARERQSGSPSPAEEAATPRVVGGAVVADPLGHGGADSVPEAEDVRAGRDIEGTPKGNPEVDTVPEATLLRDEAKSDLLSAEGQEEPEKALTPISEETGPKSPSIPLAELVPLRHLLDSATSVKECQMLLSAILSQWGVPPTRGEEGKGEDPESRIAAWLLAGRQGPVGDLGKAGTHEKEASSEVTAVASSAEKEGDADGVKKGEEEGLTLSGVVEDIKKAAVEGLQGIGKVF